jgi:hypothetical protein
MFPSIDFSYWKWLTGAVEPKLLIAAGAAVVAVVALLLLWWMRRSPVAHVKPEPAENADLRDIYRQYSTSETLRRRVPVHFETFSASEAAGAGASSVGATVPLVEGRSSSAVRSSSGVLERGFLMPLRDGGEKFKVRDAPVRLGRHSDNDIVLNDPTVHRHHAVVALDDGGRLEVRDLGGVNGVYVNGVRLDHHVLSFGDVIELGEVRVRYVEA